MGYFSLILSCISLIGAAFVYFSTDKKLKKQQLLINDYALQKQKVEEDELKSARIEATGRGGNGEAYFVVQNVGKVAARNVRFSLDTALILGSNPFPLKIMSPTDSVRIRVYLTLNDSISTYGTFTWEDELGEHSLVHVLSFT